MANRLTFSPLRLAWSLVAGLAVGGCVQTAAAIDKLPAPAQDLEAGGGATRTAVFAAGCFWCVEAVFEGLDGVKSVVSGYAGGTKADADYKKVSSGSTGHAEAVEITYDPSKISYGALLHVLFSTHDPTTKDRQGPDWGHQYRSAIFFASPDEKRVAAAYIAQLDAAKVFTNPIVTTLEPLGAFYPAEEYHQDFVARHPSHGYVRQWALPKLEKVKKLFGAKLKKKD
jgi:peptide-methionine (S)-S-oxide reductase